MRKSDVTCPTCNAGYRRVELVSRPGAKGEFRCLLCDALLEVLDGSTDVALRLTVQPEKTFDLQSRLSLSAHLWPTSQSRFRENQTRTNHR